MRIALIDTACNPEKPGLSGLSDVIWNMAIHMQRLGDEVHVFGPYIVERYPDHAVAVHAFAPPWPGWQNLWGQLRIPLCAWRELKRTGPFDVIHAAEYTTTGVLGLCTTRMPMVMTTPGNIYEHIVHGNPYVWETTQVYKVLARISARRCKQIIATCQDMALWWAYTGAPPTRISVIPYGVNTDLFRPIPEARSRLGLPEDKKILLFVGRLDRSKGLPYLLQAAQLLVHTHDFELYIVGSGPEEHSLKEIASTLGIEKIVKFRSWADLLDVPLWYSAADVCVAPSVSEGFLRVFAEAMACGCLFVGTPVAGMKDHIVSGKTGFLVRCRDAENLAETLDLVLQDSHLARHIAQAAREYVLNHLDWRMVVPRIREEVYAPVTGR